MNSEYRTVDEDISLRDVILGIQDFLRFSLRRWLLIAIFALVGAIIAAAVYYTEPVRYRSDMTFIVNEEEGGGGAGVGAILGQFGLGGGGGEMNFDKIMAMSRSKRLVNEMLLDTFVIKDQVDLLGNLIIEEYNLVEEWEMDPLSDATHLDASNLADLSEDERKTLKNLYSFVLYNKDPLLSISVNELTSILTISALTTDEMLSLLLSEEMYDRLSQFYSDESTGASQKTVARLSEKADSILRELNSAEYQLASLADTRLGITQRRDFVQQSQLNRKVSILSIAYGEILRNLEAASFTLSTRDPFFQIIDDPFLPLDRERDSYLEMGVLGGFLGLGLGVVLVGILWIYHRAMSPT